MPHLPGTGAIYGIVAEDAVPKASTAVRLYDRSNGALIRTTISGGDGSFAFTGLNTQTSDYQVMAQDEDGGPSYKNAEIVDRITPTSMHVGTAWREGWYREMCKIGFQYFWPAPAYDVRHGTTPGLSGGNRTSVGLNYAGSNTHNQASMLPQVPELPSVTLGAGATPGSLLLDTAGASSYVPANTYLGNTHSFVAVIDFDNATGWVIASERRRLDSSYSVSPLLRLRYDYATKTITTAIAAGVGASANETGDANNERPTVTALGSVVFTDRPVGVHMITAVFVAGASLKVYMDGDPAPVINSLAGVPTAQTTVNSYHCGAFFSAYSTTNPYPTGLSARLGFYARAQRELTTADVANIYSWLFTTDAPVNETGIRRAIMGAYPEAYFELTTSATFGDYDRMRSKGVLVNNEVASDPFLALYGDATDTTSPVVGGSAVSLPGTSCWAGAPDDSAPCGNVGYAASWIFHLRMNATDTGVIAKIVNGAALTTTAGWSIEVSAGNKFSLVLTGDATHTLAYTIPNTTDLIVGLVMDKTTITSPTLKLYIDGVLQETLNITEALPTYAAHTKCLRIGGDYNGSVVSNGLNAVIGQFAKFNYALTPTQMSDIYAARLVP